MAKETVISNEAAIACIDALTALLNGGGIVEIWSGTKPADVSAALTGTKLGTLTLSATAFAAASDNTGSAQALANAITSETNAVAGTASHFRAFKSDTTTGVLDGTVGTSDADMVLNKVIFDAGDDITASSWAVNLSES